MSNPKKDEITIGILAMQGAFVEHQIMLQKLSLKPTICLVRSQEDLERCDGLIIPGGESTTIALLARLAGLLEPLREFVAQKPVWGTCAGAILLSKSVLNTKRGGQEVLGGVSITTERNGWGSQVESFEVPLTVEGLRDSDEPFMGTFIRAPVVVCLQPGALEPAIEVISRLSTDLLPRNQTVVAPDEDDTDPTNPRTIVALRQGHHLVTTFHPELTKDDRFHDYFVRHCVIPSLKH